MHLTVVLCNKINAYSGIDYCANHLHVASCFIKLLIEEDNKKLNISLN